MSDKGSDTIITLIGSVKNVGIIPHKNVDHATPWAPAAAATTGPVVNRRQSIEPLKKLKEKKKPSKKKCIFKRNALSVNREHIFFCT